MNSRFYAVLAALLLMAVPLSADADTKAGVDAWAQGDYAKAVRQWLPLAQAGDADAQFNLGQAYKMGRGVPQDMAAALGWYAKATAQGHVQADDAYGLLLYQQNRRPEAMPHLQRAAERGEPRAQYLVGIALFNGDLLPKDWAQAYALMTRASAAGVEQASTALGHMDHYLPEAQRRDGLALAAAMEARKAQPSGLAQVGVAPPLRPAPSAAPIRSVSLPPSLPAPPSASVTIAAPAPAAPPPPALTSAWQVQLGAFGEATRAQTQWNAIAAKVPSLAATSHRFEQAGAMTRLLAGAFATRAEADALCARVKAAGADCIVKPR